MRYDLLIQGGTVVDGTGAPARTADVGIVGDRIVAVGDLGASAAARVIDARGLLVTPGFVDVHTHYDGQATWDPLLTPSSQHGVTTVVMGNCGVGFAPVRPDRHQWLIGLMEGVEDIPGAALAEGIQFSWESFPAYLDALDAMPRVLDVCAQVPHGALRGYVMDERGAKNEPATKDDNARMRALATEALRAGAFGISTSRTPLHMAVDGEVVPGTHADIDELMALALALKDAGHGVFQMALEHARVPGELPLLAELSQASGRPVTFNLSQIDADPSLWRQGLARLDDVTAQGAQVFAQVAGRSIGVVMGLELTANPLLATPTMLQLQGETLADKVKALRDPDVRARLLTDDELDLGPLGFVVKDALERVYVVEGDVDYEPGPGDSVAARARALGVHPRALALDALLKDDGRGLLYRPLFNYADGNLDVVETLHKHPRTLMGLSDAGAHCGAICDGAMPTFMLSFWARDRQRGRLPLEQVVLRQTRQTARFFGLPDRGTLEVGMRADLNVIDLERLSTSAPRVAYDLPAGGRRLVQDARGYRATVCAGVVTVDDDVLTGALPGRLVRAGVAAARAGG